MRVKTAKQQLKEQLRHCKSKQEANTLIVRAISRISDKDPDKTYLTAGLRKVAEEFKKSFRYARLPETNDQKKDKKAHGKKKQDKIIRYVWLLITNADTGAFVERKPSKLYRGTKLTPFHLASSPVLVV